jgi:predicted DNA-binding transcriptional regulator AlpA
LYTWVSDGRAPRSVRIGGRRKYRQADLDAWLKAAEQAEDERLAKIQATRA